MKTEYYKEYSQNLGRDMEFKVYGHSGRPFLVFPSQDGRFFDYENNGMIDAAKDYMNQVVFKCSVVILMMSIPGVQLPGIIEIESSSRKHICVTSQMNSVQESLISMPRQTMAHMQKVS